MGLATYKKISKVEFQIPDNVSPEARDLIRKVPYEKRYFVGQVTDIMSSFCNMMRKNVCR